MHRPPHGLAACCALLVTAAICSTATTHAANEAEDVARQTSDQQAADTLAAEVLATLEAVMAHCPRIRIDPRVRDRIIAASAQEDAALREDEAYFSQMLKLNPLLENYDHETGCRMLSRTHAIDAPGLLWMD